MADGDSGPIGPPVFTATGGLHAIQSVFGRFAVARTLPSTILVSLGIQAVNLCGGVVLARALGPTDRGYLALAMVWPTLIAAVGGLGVGEAATYLIGRNADRLSEIFSASLILGLIQSLLLIVMGWLTIPHLIAGKPSVVISASLFYLWVIPLFPFTAAPLAVLQGRLWLGPFNLARASVHVFYTAILLALWVEQGVSIRSALAASLIASSLTLFITFGLVAKRVRLKLRFSLHDMRPLLTYGVKLHLGNVASLLIQRADLVALALLASAATLGNYVVATAVAAGAGLVPAAASMVLFPIFSNRDQDSLGHGVARFAIVAGGFTIVAGPILAIALPWVLPYLFGSVFASAKFISIILVAAYLIRGWNQMLSSILRGSGVPLATSVGEIGGLVVTAALLIYLVPWSGAHGAAISVVVGACSTFAWLAFQTFRVSKLTTERIWTFWSLDIAAFTRLIRHANATEL